MSKERERLREGWSCASRDEKKRGGKQKAARSVGGGRVYSVFITNGVCSVQFCFGNASFVSFANASLVNLVCGLV